MHEHPVSEAAGTGAGSAVDALAWATEVATASPALLSEPPPLPTAEALAGLDLGTLRSYLDRLLLGRHTREGLEALQVAGVLQAWMPEVQALVGFGDNEWQHKDVWKHTKQVVWQSVPRLEVRWAALLHDIGKVKTRRVEADGRVHFFGHSEVGAAMFRKRVAQRLGFEDVFYERLHFLILHHLRASQYDGSWTDTAVRRFDREMGEGLRDLLDLSRADITTKRPERKRKGLSQISELARRIEQVRAEDARPVPLPKGLGTTISERFGVPPSRQLGELRSLLEREVEEGRLESQREPEYYLDWLAQRRSELGF